jgi:hypothetical protein
MGRAETDEGLPAISICPRCGARLVTRNLWHSCGTYTLEGLFPNSDPAVLDLARKYVAMLYALGDVQVIPQKTRLTCVARVRFAGLQPRKDSFLASFALHRWLDSPRIVKTVDYGPRWRAPSQFGLRAIWTTNSVHGFRSRTTSWACRATCDASRACGDSPMRQFLKMGV